MGALAQSITTNFNIGDAYKYGPYRAVITQIYNASCVEVSIPGGRRIIHAHQLEGQVTSKTQTLLAADAYRLLLDFVPSSQLKIIEHFLDSEDGQFYQEKLAQIEGVIQKMPPIYGQDGTGDEAIIHLHYFSGDHDWYITEKDVDDPFSDNPVIVEQHQAFGFTVISSQRQNAELGYISIEQLLSNANVELDLYWEPVTIASIKNNL